MLKNPIFWSAIAVFISLLAASWTGYTNYKTAFSPFHVELAVGHPAFVRSNDEKGENYCMTPIIPIEFANVGATPGSIRDVVVIVSAGNWKVLLQAEAFSKSFGANALTEEQREIFHPFMLNAKERLFKTLIFNPSVQPRGWKPALIRNGELLPDGPYLFKFYLNSGSVNRLRLVCERSYAVPENILVGLANGKGRPYVPFDEATIKARKSLEEELSE